MVSRLEVSQVAGEGGRFTLAARGDLDLDSSPQLLEAIRAALKGASRLDLDLKGVSYVDSSGIAVLIQGLKLARKRAVEYFLIDPSRQLLAVIELSQLQQFFPIAYSGREARGDGPDGGAA